MKYYEYFNSPEMEKNAGFWSSVVKGAKALKGATKVKGAEVLTKLQKMFGKKIPVTTSALPGIKVVEGSKFVRAPYARTSMEAASQKANDLRRNSYAVVKATPSVVTPVSSNAKSNLLNSADIIDAKIIDDVSPFITAEDVKKFKRIKMPRTPYDLRTANGRAAAAADAARAGKKDKTVKEIWNQMSTGQKVALIGTGTAIGAGGYFLGGE